MRSTDYILLALLLCLTFSAANGVELDLPQGTIFTVHTPIPGVTQIMTDTNSLDLITEELQSTPDSKTPVIRYTNENLPSPINNLIDHIDFQTTSDKKGQAFIYYKLPTPDASVNQSRVIADFILGRKEWKGDRSNDSVTGEIYIHWVADNALPLFTTNPVNEALYKQYVIGAKDKRPSPVYPTHLGYNYSGLDKTNLMDQFLLTL